QVPQDRCSDLHLRARASVVSRGQRWCDEVLLGASSHRRNETVWYSPLPRLSLLVSCCPVEAREFGPLPLRTSSRRIRPSLLALRVEFLARSRQLLADRRAVWWDRCRRSSRRFRLPKEVSLVLVRAPAGRSRL